ncbi:MAG: hypothetical protein AB7G75_33880 [Candidatus Binatia bacterium]
MTPLGQLRQEDMQLRNLSLNTQRTYPSAVAKFAQHFGQFPDQVVRSKPDYQFYLPHSRRVNQWVIRYNSYSDIAVSRCQQAKSLELRAVMSLVRLCQQQAALPESRPTHHVPRTRLDEARTMLSEVYNWFTEGFDTKDLQEAKTLLEELGEKAKWGNGETDKR